MNEDAHACDQPPRARFALSLVQGGPLFHLLVRARLSGAALQMLWRRILVTLAIVWVPLLLLAVLEGSAAHGEGVSFLTDVGAQVRFLIALPLLLAAEPVVHRQMHQGIPLFVERGMIDDEKREHFAGIIVSARRWIDWTPGELALLILVVTVSLLGGGVPMTAGIPGATWYRTTLADGGQSSTMAGWWFAAVSLPLFQFLLLRWYFRLLVWWRFLCQVSRIPLQLQPLHPDRLGGLGFLSRMNIAFVPLLLAQSALASGLLADQILHGGASLSDLGVEIGAACALLLVLIIGPLFAFAPLLIRARFAGLAATEALAMDYTRSFERKWLSGAAPVDEPLLGSADVQSLADLGNSFQVVSNMSLAPISLRVVGLLAAAALAPMMPLLLTTFSLQEIASRLLKVLL